MHGNIAPENSIRENTGQLTGNDIDQALKESLRDRYPIQRILGKRAGRRTFLAKDSQTGQPVAIKIMIFGPDATWEALKLFEREAQTLKTLNHPAIPKYLDFFELETRLVKGFALVQTYIQAKSLQDLVTSGRRFSEQELKLIAQSILTTLHYLHSSDPRVIHRDIKPSNILLSDVAPNHQHLNQLRDKGQNTLGQLSLIDFGSVQTVQHDGTMTIVGTYGYMAPEQFGGRANPASDLYGLGATLIYLATGEHPIELMQDGLQIEFSSNLSESFSQWIQQLTNIDLAKRTASASAALHQLTLPQKSTGQSTGQQNPDSNTNRIVSTISRSQKHRERRQNAQQRSRADFQLYYLAEESILKAPVSNTALSQEPVTKELEIEFYQRRLQGKGLRLTLPDLCRARLKRYRFHRKQDPVWARKADALAVISFLPLASIIITNGGLTWFLIGLLLRLAFIGLLITGLYLSLFTSPMRLWFEQKHKRARLRLQHHPYGAMKLALITPIHAFESNPQSQPNQSLTKQERNPIHISEAVLKEITISPRPWPWLSLINFSLEADKYHGKRQIEVLCTAEEASWLRNRIEQWGEIKIMPSGKRQL